jgi:nitrogen regulatory protein PII
LFSVLSIFPTQGSTAGATTAWISGTGFRSHATVTVDGSRVEATVVDETTISLAMPAHAEGKVDVAVSQSPQAQTGVPGGYTYAFVVPPVISELLPNIGSTGGRTPMTIRGAGFQNGLTVMVGGRKYQNQYSGDHTLAKIFTDAHVAGTVDLIVTNPDGGQASSKFTYASPATFDFNGVWQGIAQDWDGEVAAPFVLTIRDNLVVSLSCGASSLTLDPTPVVANGQFRSVYSNGGLIEGSIVSPNFASGYVNLGSCAPAPYWSAEKK